MRAKEMKAARRRLEAVLTERWDPRPLDEHAYAFPWVAGCIPVSCYVEINPDMEGFLFRAIHERPVAPAQRGVVGEFIHRVNYEQPIGAWAIDLDSGDIRFKNGVYFRGGELTELMIRNVLDSSLFFVGHDIMGFVKLQNGGTLGQAMAARGQDYGEGFIEGMKAPDGE